VINKYRVDPKNSANYPFFYRKNYVTMEEIELQSIEPK